jgi:hypothetical protein
VDAGLSEHSEEDETAIATHEAPGTTAFDELARLLRGELLVPTSPAYDRARRVWNGAIDRHPACIARCTGAADVARRCASRATTT